MDLKDISNQNEKLEAILDSVDKLLESSDSVLDNFYNMEITTLKDEKGKPLTSDDFVGDKLEFLNMQYQLNKSNGTNKESDISKFKADLNANIKKSEDFKEEAKRSAESFLKYKKSLLDFNKNQIEELELALNDFKMQDEQLSKQIDDLKVENENLDKEAKKIDNEIEKDTNKKNSIEEELKQLDQEQEDITKQIIALEDEKSNISKDDPDYEEKLEKLQEKKNSLDEKQNKSTQKTIDLSRKSKTIKSRLDKKISRKKEIAQLKKSNKIKEKIKEKKDLNYEGKVQDIKVLKEHNQRLYDEFDMDFETLDKKLGKYGMKMEDLNISKDENVVKDPDQAVEKEAKSKENTKNNSSNVVSNTCTPQMKNEPQVQDKALIPLGMDKRTQSKKIFDEFSNLTKEEQEQALLGSGYNELMSALPNLNHVDRKKINTMLANEKNRIPEINKQELISTLRGLESYGVDIYDVASKMFGNFNVKNENCKYEGINSKALSKEDLAKLAAQIHIINENRDQIPSELIKNLDDKFLKNVKLDTLSNNATFANRAKGWFNNILDKGLGDAKKDVNFALSNYSTINSRIAKENVDTKLRNNSFKEQLGMEIYPPANIITAQGLNQKAKTLDTKQR